MGRLLVFMALLAAVAVTTVIVAAAAREVGRTARMALGWPEEGEMGSNGIQKAAFVVLIALMAGVASGLIGGL